MNVHPIHPRAGGQAAQPVELPIIDATAWFEQEPPERRFIVDRWLARGTAALLVGEDGVGKSLLAQQLATCVAAGRPFLGLEVTQAPALYVTCEDDENELWRRQRAINRAIGTPVGAAPAMLSTLVGYAGTLVLDGGMSWKAAQISPEDAELLETRKFGVVEICRLFQVPPPIVQAYENNTFTNAAQAGLWFATFCLAPWARKIEAEFARSVFPAGGDLELELDLSGFLRGDPQTRWAAHKIAIETNVLDADEVRQIEGWNPRSAAQ